MNKQVIGAAIAVVFLMGAAAAVASYTTRESLEPHESADAKPVDTKTLSNTALTEPTAPKKPEKKYASAETAQPARPAQPRCDDSNIVGTVAGGAAGGIAGSFIGHGTGKTVATIGGALGGAVLGNQYIPTRNVTCRH